MQPHRGFTLLELIIVLVLISVLAVTLLPRFFTNSGTAEYLYRDQALSLLRRVQMQAMQCTDTAKCPDASVTVSAAVITPNVLHFDALTIDPKDKVTFSPGITIRFDSLGRPLPMPTEIILNINQLRLCINREGYIHSC
ncbi:prepilin-type N-terminal cleavage/methylation domain-containing protein [Chromatiaceae bacterium AAb-1]|nr:prepilin-type N-terminal cleavage/methylation domain-containing protein [Chromatiaceae bacterium AAb-1]